jgi:hypothetical protein
MSKHAEAEMRADQARHKTGREIDRAARSSSRRSSKAASKRGFSHSAFTGTLPGSHAYRSAAILHKMAHKAEPSRTHAHTFRAGRRHRRGRSTRRR